MTEQERQARQALQERIDRSVKFFIDVLTVIILAIIAVIIVLMVARPAPAGECLGSPREVRAAHGIAAWSTWHIVDGEKCWMLGRRKEVVPHGALRSAQIMRGRDDTRLTHDTQPRPSTPAGAIPLPRPRLGYREITVEEGKRLIEWSDELMAKDRAEMERRRNRFMETFGAVGSQ
jgi:hypothetical protein